MPKLWTETLEQIREPYQTASRIRESFAATYGLEDTSAEYAYVGAVMTHSDVMGQQAETIGRLPEC